MRPGRRVFWPFLITALMVVLCHPRMVVSRSYEPDWRSTMVAASFGGALLVLGWLRSRFGVRLTDGFALLLCGVPFLVGLAIGEVQVPVDTDSFRGKYEAWEVINLRAFGAMFSLSLLLAELVTWCRFGVGRGRTRALGAGLLLAVPFQLGWLAQVSAEDFDPLRLNLLVPVLALMLVPLSLARGGARTARVLVGLTLATCLVNVIEEGRLTCLAFERQGCGPATNLQNLSIHELEVFPVRFLELFPWAPGVVAVLCALVFLRRQQALAAVAALVVFTALDAFAVSRLSRFQDELSNSRLGDEFIPRGRGESRAALRLSSFVLLGPEGLLLRNPLVHEEELGAEMAAHAVLGPRVQCNGEDLKTLSLTLDQRLSPAQELDVARVARGHGIEMISFVEGEDSTEPGSPFVLRTHLARLLSGASDETLYLGKVPPDCRADSVRTGPSPNWHAPALLVLP